MLLSRGRDGETGLTTVAQGEGNWGLPLLATPEELAEEGLMKGAAAGDFESASISESTVDASLSTLDDRASNLGTSSSIFPPTLDGTPTETFLILVEVPVEGPLDDLGFDFGLLE